LGAHDDGDRDAEDHEVGGDVEGSGGYHVVVVACALSWIMMLAMGCRSRGMLVVLDGRERTNPNRDSPVFIDWMTPECQKEYVDENVGKDTICGNNFDREMFFPQA
jgi:hypothetical protein